MVIDYRKSSTWHLDVKFDALSLSPSRQRYDRFSVGSMCSLRLHFRFAPYPGPHEYLAAAACILALIHDISRYLLSRQAYPLVHPVVRWHLSTVIVYPERERDAFVILKIIIVTACSRFWTATNSCTKNGIENTRLFLIALRYNARYLTLLFSIVLSTVCRPKEIS